jgi:hypothetical protein
LTRPRDRRGVRPRRAAIDGTYTTRVDILDEQARFITSANCEISVQGGSWSGTLTGIEPNAHLGSGRYRLRTRDGAEAEVAVRGRQRVGSEERYPFTGVGPPAAFGGS